MQYDDRDLRKLQLLELRILKEIDRVCRKLGIDVLPRFGVGARGAAPRRLYPVG